MTHKEPLHEAGIALAECKSQLQSLREELSCVKEELTAINGDFRRKTQELMELTADLEHLVFNRLVSTIFLDKELRVRRLAPAFSETFGLPPQQNCTPIEDIACKIGSPGLYAQTREDLMLGEPLSIEATDRNGDAISLLINPYKNEANAILGVSISVDFKSPLEA